ncbi:MAG: PKD domain-containing protein [Patescibacteria group bacterium]
MQVKRSAQIAVLTIFSALLLSGIFIETTHGFSNPYNDPNEEDTRDTSRSDFDSQHDGIIGGALNTAGNVVKDTFEGLFGSFGGGEDQLPTSFVDFQGGLQPPSGRGLASELTQATTAREFILNVVNFALSFLGLIAVLMVIYGGYVYVTSAGNDDKSGEGKKTITYAAIGILIILGSFAAVNTLIRSAPSGDEDRGGLLVDGGTGGTRGAATGSITGALSQDRLYNLAALEVRSSAERFVNAYAFYASVDASIRQITESEMPSNGLEARQFLRQTASVINQIIRSTGTLSHLNRAAKNFYNDFIRKNLELSSAGLEDAFSNAEGGGFDSDAFKTALDEALDPEGFTQPAIVTANQVDFILIIDRLIRAKEDATYRNSSASGNGSLGILGDISGAGKLLKDQTRFEPGTLILLREALGSIAEVPASQAINAEIRSPDELRRALENIPPSLTVGEAFEDAIKSLQLASNKNALLENPDSIQHVTNVITDMHRLFVIVNDIQFVSVRINATATEGNAPFAVQFDSLGSLDPSGKTITDNKHSWDLNGNGTAGEIENDCREEQNTTVTCVYKTPGTYRISLEVESNEQDIAHGLAFLTIIVNPPLSRIHLEAQAGQTSETLQEYDEAGRRVIDKESFRLTTEEAKAGISFDASQSTDSAGRSEGLKNFKWSFGDGTDSISGQTIKTIENHTYATAGTYPLSLEVTDGGGVKDRTVVNIVVNALAARINSHTFRGDFNTTFSFDGSQSKSDVGQIESFEWKIFDAEDAELEVQNNTSDTLRYRFNEPGSYMVQLTVTDTIGNIDIQRVEVLIESRAPNAAFDVMTVNPAHPSTVTFDAANSFDPDEGDTLKYQWDIVGKTVNVDYSVEDGTMGSQNDGTKNLTLKFNAVGEYNLKLTVTDQHENSEIRRSDTFEKKVNIESVINADWDANIVTAKRLEEGAVTFTLTANTSGGADTYTVEDDEGTVIALDQPVNPDGAISVPVTYSSQGTHIVTLTVSSDTKGTTSIMKRLYIGGSEEPMPVVQVTENSQEVVVENDTISILRGQNPTFDASQSIDSFGNTNIQPASNRLLEFQWRFDDAPVKTGPAVKLSQLVAVSDLRPGEHALVLTVLQKQDGTDERLTAQRTINVNIETAKPKVQNIVVRRLGDEEETPIDVEVTAHNAVDPDGQIREYRFWYFDSDNPEQKLGTVRKSGQLNNKATLTIGTHGESGQLKRYLICVEVLDDENNTAACDELFEEDTLPYVEVINGQNQAPTADFTMNRNSIKAGDSVQFTASVNDPDGNVVKYVWDTEGDGFQNNAEGELSQITYTYRSESSEDGFQVQLKVIDDKGAIGFSETKPVYVDNAFEPPIADFAWEPTGRGTEIRFVNRSRSAPGSQARIVGYKWDFGMRNEFFCNTDPLRCDLDTTNDVDSTSANPTFQYPEAGIYKVRLTVEDSNGQTADIITANRARVEEPKDVEVIRGQAGDAIPIEAVLKTNPEPNADGVIVLSGNGGDVTFFLGESRGDIEEYRLDYNIYYDTGTELSGERCDNPADPNPINGDGCRDNDSDFRTTDGATRQRVRYLRDYATNHPQCYMTAQLTTIGRDDTGARVTDVDTVNITFSTPPSMPNCTRTRPSAAESGAANISNSVSTNTAILLGLMAGAILAGIGYFVSLIAQRGKPRI